MTNSDIARQFIGIQNKFQGRILSAEVNSKHYTSNQPSNASSLTKRGRLGPKITEMLKRMFTAGGKLLQVGGATKAFNQNFSVIEGEKLVKSFKCYLSTTSHPIAGFLFISLHKVAFLSEKLLEVSSPTGELTKIHYKIVIPLSRITKARENKDKNYPLKNYVEIVTRDNIKFWFLGFLNQKRTFQYLQRAISQANL